MGRNDTTVRIDIPDYERLRKLAKRYGLDNKEIMGTLLEICDEHNLLRKDWEKRLNESLKRADLTLELSEFEELDDAPRAMKWSELRFVYVERTKSGNMKVTKLSPVCSEALAVCREFELQGAEEREQILHDNLLMVSEAKKAELTVGITQTIKIQKCNAGASLVGNGKNFRYCRMPQAEGKGDVSIKGWCKVIQSKGPCESLAFTELPYDSYEIVAQQLKKAGKKHTNNR